MSKISIAVSYAYQWLSFLLREPGMKDMPFRNIYLFGSAARGDYDGDSDIDIFLDTGSDDNDIISRTVSKSLRKFEASSEKKKFGARGISNQISPKVGRLESWSLRESVMKEGLSLLSSGIMKGSERKTIFVIEAIRPVSRRNRVMRKLGDRKEKGFHGKGMVGLLGGEWLSPRVFIIPSESSGKVSLTLSEENVGFRMRDA